MPILKSSSGASALFTLSGTAIGAGGASAYTFSSPYQVGRANRLRFWCHVVVSGGSALVLVTYKLQHRFNDGTIQTSFLDIPTFHTSDLNEAIEHAMTVSQPGTFDDDSYLDLPNGVCDVQFGIKSSQVGQNGDSAVIYASAAMFRS